METFKVHFLPASIGVSAGNRGPAVPPPKEVASLDEAKAEQIPAMHTVFIEAPDGYHVNVGGQWQFHPYASKE